MDWKHFLLDNYRVILIVSFLMFLYVKIKIRLNRYSEKREFSKCESPIEEKLFLKIRERGRGMNGGDSYKVYTQVKCGYYRIDLALYANGKKIAIECDGKDYHTSKSQIKHDKKKDRYLKKHGWKVLRFTGSEIYRSSDKCVDDIERLIHKRKFLF